MTKEDNIIVPRWFLVVVKNTLRIQNNINLNEKTGETCQDRNIRQSLNGICKLLKGEELTGMERLEKLQPSLPSNLDEAAFKYENELWESGYKNCGYSPQEVNDAFKAGANWRDSQIPKLPSNIDEVAEEYAIQGHESHTNTNYINTYIEGKRIGFVVGAKWMAEQFVIDGELADGTPVYLKK